MLGSVVVACIAGIASFFTCMALAAQAPSDVALKVKVTDTTGTAISRAKIQARTPDSRIKSETQTDSRGEAVLYLDRETSIVSVHAPGFEVWQYQIEGGKDVDKQLIAVLRIESYYGPTLVNPEPRLETGIRRRLRQRFRWNLSNLW